MTLRTALFFLLAISSGLLAAAGVTQMRSSSLASAIVKVLVVKKPISRGARIDLEHLELRDIPKEFVHEGMADSADQVVGRVAIAAMVQGEFVMNSKLTSSRASGGIAALIPAGMRAKSISAVSPADRVSGLLDVGDRVDVLLTRSAPGLSRGMVGVAETLLQNIEVLAIDRVFESKNTKSTVSPPSRNEPKSSSITLLVTPEQASLLSLAQREGVLSFSLRNPEDEMVIEGNDSANRLQQLVFQRGEEFGLGLDSEADPKLDLKGDSGLSEASESDSESDESLTISDLQALISDGDGTGRSVPGFGAIRTIRGSRTGVVPIRTKSK
jgi:pilus assembly protein CpaB